MNLFQHIREDIRCIYDRDPAARHTLEIITTYPGVQAMFAYRIAHVCWHWRLKWLARFIAALARWFTGIEIHPGASIGRRFFIDHGMGVVIGETAEIGDDCTLYHGVTLGGTTWQKGKRHPTLGNGVIVGAGAKVLGPLTVGAHARIGANAVVIKNVPEGMTVVGVPGHVVHPKPDAAMQAKRQEMASKLGFDAYGMTRDMTDPVAHAINRMLDHLHQLDERVNALCRVAKQRQNGDWPALDSGALASCEIDECQAQPLEPAVTPTAENSTAPQN